MRYSKATAEYFAGRTGYTIGFLIRRYPAYQADSYGLISALDEDYPWLVDGNGLKMETQYSARPDNPDVLKASKDGAPEFLLYQGDISLLNRENFQRNVAVIGTSEPSLEIVHREQEFVSELVTRGMQIVSGLARGCDTVAHETCLRMGGKTIAILPSPLYSIIPAENQALAQQIVQREGLLITEYYTDPNSAWEQSHRFIERDRLQAYFSKAVILTASYGYKNTVKKSCGSRHALRAAGEICRKRYVLYNPQSDAGNSIFALNRELLYSSDWGEPAQMLTREAIQEICQIQIREEEPVLSFLNFSAQDTNQKP